MQSTPLVNGIKAPSPRLLSSQSSTMQGCAGGSWQFGFGGKGPRVVRVVLLGQPVVGKTAIAVRFATRRYIGEYDCTAERLYRVDGPLAMSWELADSPGNPAKAPSESRLRWADAVLLVYSVTDRVSFDETWRLRFLLNQARKSSKKLPPPVVLLVGNKTDLAGPPDGDRMVSTAEGQRRAVDIEAQAFHEISARESLDQVMSVFVSVARLLLLAQSGEDSHVAGAFPFRLRASTDSSIDARRRPNIQQPLSKRRLSISVRGAPH